MVRWRQAAAARQREFIRGLIRLRAENDVGVDAVRALVDAQGELSDFQKSMLKERVKAVLDRVQAKAADGNGGSPVATAVAAPPSAPPPSLEVRDEGVAAEAVWPNLAPSEPLAPPDEPFAVEAFRPPPTMEAESLLTVTRGEPVPRPATDTEMVTIHPEPSRATVITVLHALVAKAVERLPADLCQVYIQEGGALNLRAEAPAEGGALPGPTALSRKAGLAAQVGSLGRAVALLDLTVLSGIETIWVRRGMKRLAAVGVGTAGEDGSGIIIAGRTSTQPFTEGELDLLDELAIEVSGAIASADLLSRAEELAVLKERMMLAREIHDGLASDLSAVVALFKYHERRRKIDPEDADRLLEQMRELVEGSLRSARDILATLRPRQQPPADLVDAVQRHVEDFANTYGITAVVRIDGTSDDVDHEEREAIYQVLREALTNIRRHSEAGSIEVQLDLRKRPYQLIVDDDGIGVDLASLEDKIGSFGLTGMRERAELLGGAFEVGTGALGGMQITFRGAPTRLGSG